LRSRILIVFAGLILLWSLLILRAASLQIFPNARLKALQERQFQTVITLNSRRGAIVDRKGRELAVSQKNFSIFADPKILEEKKVVARKLAKTLGVTVSSIYSKIKDHDKRFVWIARLLPKEKTDLIKSWEIRGLSIIEEYQRIYPNETLLSQALGMVGSEGQGLEGIELQYDSLLRGSQKKVSVRRDARGRPLLIDGQMFAEDPEGIELKLTIDTEMQNMMQGELTKAVQEFDADQAFGVILDAQTSAILALVNTPLYDVNKAAKIPQALRRNRIVTDAFEPGSTMKTFAIAGALRRGLLAPNTKYNTENGAFKVADHWIHEAETKEHWAQLTVSEILAYSSNVGAAKIAFDLGDSALREGLVDFGFGTKSGVDLPGDGKGILPPLPWNQHLLSNIAFGQGVAVTPLQIANAYAAIANGGVLNSPYIVSPTSANKESDAKEGRRVLSKDQADQMRNMLLGVTAPGGTGVSANIEGFQVAGKTGTAQKVNPTGRGYLKNGYISSFAGFLPANDPRFVIYVAVDYPKKTAYYGAVVAAPVFARVAAYAARLEGLSPTLLTKKNMPALAQKTNSKHKTANEKPQQKLADLEKEELRAEMKASLAVHKMPNMTNLTMREVLQNIQGESLDIKFVGTGLVKETIPAAGAELKDDKKITLILK
jgi:cell division protein FtsI (penicillin-binding protein 3)